MAEELARTNVLSLEDARMVREAEGRGDHVFIRELGKVGPRGLRAELKVRLAQAAFGGKQVRSKDFAAEFGVKPESVMALRNSLGFKKELGEFIDHEVLAGANGVLLQQTVAALKKGISKGEPWAVMASLKMHGLLGPKEKKREGGSFEDSLNITPEGEAE